jgi:hypothetical protein
LVHGIADLVPADSAAKTGRALATHRNTDAAICNIIQEDARPTRSVTARNQTPGA